jgi:molybdopterin molybdotransferase
MIGLLAAQGIARVRVGGTPTAAVISTGDELKPAGVNLEPGEIYESNGALLSTLLDSCGVRIHPVTHCADKQPEIEAAIRSARACDLMIISGGVSVGARDLVKPALAAAGGDLEIWRVAVKPGKPFLHGRLGSCAVFGLPGNPVSAFVTFLLFVRPMILRLRGAASTELRLPSSRARISEALHNPGDRPHYLRGRLEPDGVFRPIRQQQSHALFGLSRSNALLRLNAREEIAPHETVSVLTWD